MKQTYEKNIFFICNYYNFFSLSARATEIDISKQYSTPIGKHLRFLQEKSNRFKISDVIKTNKSYRPSKQDVISLGLGAKPVWVGFDVINSQDEKIARHVLIENSWLDKLDVYFVQKKHCC